MKMKVGTYSFQIGTICSHPLGSDHLAFGGGTLGFRSRQAEWTVVMAFQVFSFAAQKVAF